MKLKLVPFLFLIIGILARFLPHPANFAPIAAIALFSARYLPKKPWVHTVHADIIEPQAANHN